MKKLLVLGYFGYGNNKLDGQTIKTREVYSMLKRQATDAKTIYFDTQSLAASKLNILKMLHLLLVAQTVVYLPGRNNLSHFFTVLFSISRLFGKKIVYPVVGGWLPEFIEEKKSLIKRLSKLEAILVETQSMKRKLEEKYSFGNVLLFPNFRTSDYTPQFKNNSKFRIVFMARISRDKGCDRVFNYAQACLDANVTDVEISFYGPIEQSYEAEFQSRLQQYGFVSYGGVVEPSKVCDVLGNYDVLVLPTHYDGEGFPGSVVDAYRAGIPAVVSDWKDLSEVVEHGKSGYLFNLSSPLEFNAALDRLRGDNSLLSGMKEYAFELSKKYSEENAWGIIKDFL